MLPVFAGTNFAGMMGTGPDSLQSPLMLVRMMTAARWPVFAQSTSWLSIVPAAAPQAPNLGQGIVHHQAQLALQYHRHPQVLQESVCQLPLVAHSAGHYADTVRIRQTCGRGGESPLDAPEASDFAEIQGSPIAPESGAATAERNLYRNAPDRPGPPAQAARPRQALVGRNTAG